MRKIILSLTLIATIALSSCGSGSSTTETTNDSTIVNVDSTLVNDTISVDTTKSIDTTIVK